ncbi:MAG: hypothetical protein NVV62_01210 [Terricaulis sp.]|nr:hypothetical protein [Terricaulis sp.]
MLTPVHLEAGAGYLRDLEAALGEAGVEKGLAPAFMARKPACQRGRTPLYRSPSRFGGRRVGPSSIG